MTKDYTVIPLFSSPIFNTEIEPIPQEIKDYLFNTSFERMFIGNGSYSENKYILNQPEVSWLKKQVIESLDIYVREVLKVREGIDFELTNSWIVKHDKGDWGQSHIHTNCLISGVLYLQTDDNSGDIVFNRDSMQQNLFPNAIDIEYSDWNIFNSKRWKFKPHNNQIFFFPSSILHGIEDNESETTRYSLAFNFFPKGKLGGKEFELELK
jgi:uncharacterized protein (TIGR02466 family)